MLEYYRRGHMDEKTNKEASGEQEDNLSDLNASFPAIKASQEILYNMSRIYLSPQLMNLNRTIQEVGKSMYKVTTSPAMEQLANLNQVFVVDSTFKFYDSSVIESVARINQQMAGTISIIPHSLAIKNMTRANQHLVESMNTIYSSPAYQKYFKSIQQTIRSLDKISANLRLNEFINSSYLTDIVSELYTTEGFSDVVDSIEEDNSTEEIEAILQQGFSPRYYHALEKKIDLLLENDVEEKFEKEAEKKRTKKRKIIVFILKSLILPFFLPFYQPSLEVYNDWAQAPATKIIKNEIKVSYEQDIYSKVRIVKKDELKIKQSNRRDSSTIGEVNFGDVVEIIYKKKNWTKIRKVENGTILEGWVYTRYLQKIK